MNRGKEQEEIMRQLMGYGWSKEQAAGITANLIRESSLNPQAVSPSGKYRGLAQWNPERQKTFKKVMGMDVMDASRQKQVDFINWELNNTHRAAGWYLKGSRSKEDAAAAFTRHYEIPGDMAGEIARRRQIASNIPLASADGILQPSSPAGGSPGKITVDVNFQNAPPGTQVRNYVEGPVSANTRIGYSNPGTL